MAFLPSVSKTIPSKLKNVNYSVLSKDLFYEINKIRVNPCEYIKKLESIYKTINSKEEILIGSNWIKIINCAQVFNETINFLKNIIKLEEFLPKKNIEQSAEEYLNKLKLNDDHQLDNLINNQDFFLENLKKFGNPHGNVSKSVFITPAPWMCKKMFA